MYEPIIRAARLPRYAVNGFRGVNETQSAADNEFKLTENIVGDFPAAAVRPHIKAVDAAGGDVDRIFEVERDGDVYLLTGIVEDDKGRRFFYRGSPAALEGTESYSLDAQSICRMNGRIFIFPDKVYFDESAPSAGLRDMTRSESITQAVFHSETDGDGVITNYISGGSFDAFRRGESVVISGCSAEENNVVRADEAADGIVSAIVEEISGEKMYLLCYTASGADAAFKNVKSDCTVSADIPDMNKVCCHNNRLWGTAADGTAVYASKQGDPLDFNTFAGISTDSWWARVATDGGFTGIYPYQNHIYAFKESFIHEIYGDKPSNFKMPYSVRCGAVDGDSICELDGVMYFAAADGVYAYNGGVPKKISQKLCVRPSAPSKSAVHDGRIYITLGGVLYSYDAERGEWYRICGADVTGFARCGGSMCFADGGVLKVWDEGGEQVRWSVQTKEFFREGSQKNGCVSVWLKLSLSENACAAVYTSYDGGEFCRWGIVRGDSRVCRVPVRLRGCQTFAVKIEGSGDARIYGIEFENYSGGYRIPQEEGH